MKIDNFKLIEVLGSSPRTWKFMASVDCTRGIFLFQKTETVDIFRNYAGYWCFVDTGRFCPLSVQDLERSFKTKQGKDLEFCTPFV